MFDEHLLAVVDQAQAKWAGIEQYRMPMIIEAGSTDEDSTEVPYEPEISEDDVMIEKILGAYELSQIFDEEGNLRRGVRAELLDLLFGDRTDANRNKRTLDRLLELMK
jgi:hypothetical protein